MSKNETNGLNMADVQALRRDINQIAAHGAVALDAYDAMGAEGKSALAEVAAQLRNVTAQLKDAAKALGEIRGPVNKGPAMAAYSSALTAYNNAKAALPNIVQKLLDAGCALR